MALVSSLYKSLVLSLEAVIGPDLFAKDLPLLVVLAEAAEYFFGVAGLSDLVGPQCRGFKASSDRVVSGLIAWHVASVRGLPDAFLQEFELLSLGLLAVPFGV